MPKTAFHLTIYTFFTQSCIVLHSFSCRVDFLKLIYEIVSGADFIRERSTDGRKATRTIPAISSIRGKFFTAHQILFLFSYFYSFFKALRARYQRVTRSKQNISH